MQRTQRFAEKIQEIDVRFIIDKRIANTVFANLCVSLRLCVENTV